MASQYPKHRQRDNTTITAGTTNSATATFNNRWVTMATGKLGYAWDRVLLYGKGGGAWVGTSNPTVNNVPASFTSTSNSNNFGATVGLGMEWAFAGNWSARAEWDAILLQNQSFTVFGSTFGTDTITVNNRSINIFTAANYKFGGWGSTSADEKSTTTLMNQAVYLQRHTLAGDWTIARPKLRAGRCSPCQA